MIRNKSLSLLCLLLLILTGCGHDDVFLPVQGTEPDVKLVLKVNVGGTADKSDAATRATAGYYPGSPAGQYPYEFEAGSQYENIHTLRIIIVRPDNTVEHNRKMTFDPHPAVSGEEYGDFEFTVDLGQGTKTGTVATEKKRIYLIANEETTGVDFENYPFGSTLTPAVMADLKLTSSYETHEIETDEVDEDGNKITEKFETVLPFIDNDGDGEKKYVPITEFFDVDVTADYSRPAPYVQSNTLFITRSVVKFEFYVDETVENNTNQNFRVSEITFHSLGDQAYLFPFETTYQDAKESFLSDKNAQRIITAFTAPSDATLREYTFTAPSGFGHNGELTGKIYDNAWLPMKYFFGTTGNAFTIDVKVEFFNGVENDSHTFKELKLPNLPLFPRNTIVKVYFQFARTDMNLRVDLVPYIGYVLKPGFGFDELLPGDHNRPAGW